MTESISTQFARFGQSPPEVPSTITESVLHMVYSLRPGAVATGVLDVSHAPARHQPQFAVKRPETQLASDEDAVIRVLHLATHEPHVLWPHQHLARFPNKSVLQSGTTLATPGSCPFVTRVLVSHHHPTWVLDLKADRTAKRSAQGVAYDTAMLMQGAVMFVTARCLDLCSNQTSNYKLHVSGLPVLAHHVWVCWQRSTASVKSCVFQRGMSPRNWAGATPWTMQRWDDTLLW